MVLQSDAFDIEMLLHTYYTAMMQHSIDAIQCVSDSHFGRCPAKELHKKSLNLQLRIV